MLKAGLVSISFRKLSPVEIVDLVKEAGLSGIEWGGDVHVPHGNLKAAQEVARITQEAGLVTAAYGSYYRLGERDLCFSAVLDTAKTLGAPTIRVWGGVRPSSRVDSSYYQTLVADARQIAKLAEKENITIALEFHGGTITDTNESTVRFLTDVGVSNFKTYWQPAVDTQEGYRLSGLQQVRPYLSNIHAFHWEPHTLRRALAEGETEWSKYINVVKSLTGERWILLEFVRDDAPEAFLEDAKTLKRWLAL